MLDHIEVMHQIERFAGLDRYPKGAAAGQAVSELVKAAKVAQTMGIIVLCADNWLETQTVCPKPADLRAAIYELKAKFGPKKPKCIDCSGNGFVVVYFLVRYAGKSFTPVKSKRLGRLNTEQALAAFAQADMFEPEAELISAAETCPCHPTYGLKNAS